MRHIVVIETDPAPMRLLAWALEQDGFIVGSTMPDVAIDVISTSTPRCVILNLPDPVEQRRRIAAQVRLAAPGIPIIDLDSRPADPPFADAHLPNPVPTQRVVDTIRGLTG